VHLLATVLATWDIAKYVLDRPRLRVRCYIANIITPGVGRGPDLLTYDVANTGGRPAVVKAVGGALRNGKHFMLLSNTTPLPSTLQPGESISVPGPIPEQVDDIVQLFAYDGLGKKWTASRGTIRKQLLRRDGSDGLARRRRTTRCSGRAGLRQKLLRQGRQNSRNAPPLIWGVMRTNWGPRVRRGVAWGWRLSFRIATYD